MRGEHGERGYSLSERRGRWTEAIQRHTIESLTITRIGQLHSIRYGGRGLHELGVRESRAQRRRCELLQTGVTRGLSRDWITRSGPSELLHQTPKMARLNLVKDNFNLFEWFLKVRKASSAYELEVYVVNLITFMREARQSKRYARQILFSLLLKFFFECFILLSWSWYLARLLPSVKLLLAFSEF